MTPKFRGLKNEVDGVPFTEMERWERKGIGLEKIARWNQKFCSKETGGADHQET